MPQHGHGSNGHLGISHPFGAKHGTPGTGYRTLLGAPVAAQARPGAGERRPKALLHASIPDWVPRRDSRGELPSVAEIMRRRASDGHYDAEPWRPDSVSMEPYYQIAIRPLDMPGGTKLYQADHDWDMNPFDFHAEHVQFIGNDGSNFGLSKGQNTLMIEEESALGRYVAEPVKLRKEYIDRARDELERRWQERALAAFRENPSRKLRRYDVKKYNCQHYVAEVLRLAASYETRERPLVLP